MKQVIQLTILLLVLAISPTLQAAKYVVSGAGADVNGTYEDSGFTNAGHPFFILDSNSYRALIYDGKWKIASIDCCYGSEGATVGTTYYYTNNSGSNPPSSGWSNSAGALPIPSVKLVQSEILYNTLVFTESPENDGTIDNTIVITCNNNGGETFAGKDGDDFVADGKVIVSHLPAGMTARILRKDNLTLLAMLSGTPASHTNANDVSNLTFAFQNSAFAGGNAGAVGGSYRNTLKINFIQIFHVGSTGDFATITEALDACRDGDILILAAETFTEAGLTVNRSVTIQGQGARSTFVQTASSSANASSNVFYTWYGTTVTIKDLTVRYGNSGAGAGILSSGEQLNLINLDIYGNTSTSQGTIQGGQMSITNCSIHDNTGGSGIYIQSYSVATVTNSTIAKNAFDAGEGCGIYCDAGSTLHLTNCTVAENTGYGIFVYASTVSVLNTILTDNTKDDYRVQSGDALTDSGFNVVKKQSSSDNSGNWKFNQASDILYNYKADGSSSTQWNRNSPALANQNLNLGSSLSYVGLLNNGPVLPVLSGSFMINAGTDTGAPATDQVGQSRNGTTDIGAFEYAGVSATVPTVTTNAINSFNTISATMGGNISSGGGATVTERGMVYSLSGKPDITDNKVAIGSGIGSFSQSVSGLLRGTVYYVRAYATNSAGTSYGSNVSFTTATGKPVISSLNGDSGSFTEGDNPLVIDSGGDATVADGDNSGYNGGNLTVSPAPGYISAFLSISASGNLALSGGMNVGSSISIGGTVIGTITKNGYNGQNLVITFNANATDELISTLIHHIAYSNNSEVSLGICSVHFTIQNANALISPDAIVTINTFVVNDPPTLTAVGNNPTFIAGDPTVTLFSNAAASTIENGQTFTGFTLMVSNASDGSSERLFLDGSLISLSNGATGTTSVNSLTYGVSLSGLTATVTVSGGDLSALDLQSIVNSLGYHNSSGTPTETNRTVTITLLKDNGGTSNGGNDTVQLTVNSIVTVLSGKPVIANLNGDSGSFTEGNNPLLIDTGGNALLSNHSVSGYNGGNLTIAIGTPSTSEYLSIKTSANVVLSNGMVAGSTVSIGGTNIGLIAAGKDGQTGNDLIITLNANATDALLSTLLQNITYSNNSEVALGSRSVSITAQNDLTSTSSVSTVTIDTFVVNDPPALSITSTFPTFIEHSQPVELFSGATASTFESGQTFISFRLSVSNLSDGSSEQLVIDGSYVTLINGTSGTSSINSLFYSVSVTGSVAIVNVSGGTLLATNLQTILNNLSYYNSSASPSTAQRRLVRLISITDSGGVSNGGIDTYSPFFLSSVTVVATNLPTINTTAITTYNSTSATMGGDVTADGGATVTERGVVYSSSDNTPTIGEAGVTKDINGTTGTGTFGKPVAGLSNSTTYYVRAYATNSEGTAYGSVNSFTTPLGKPTVTTTGSANVSAVSADVSGNITTIGSGNATVRGVCYNTTGNPTVDDPKSETSGNYATGAFTHNLTGLTASTTYYARAYATNSGGTAYGDQVSFTTLAIPANPTAVAATYSILCQGASTQLTANDALGTVYWYTGSCGGTQVTTGNPVAVTPLASTTYYARNFNNGAFSAGCASIGIVVNPRPTVADLQASGTGIKWYLTQTGGTVLVTSTQLVNGQHYWASQTIDGLESSARFEVVVTLTNP